MGKGSKATPSRSSQTRRVVPLKDTSGHLIGTTRANAPTPITEKWDMRTYHHGGHTSLMMVRRNPATGKIEKKNAEGRPEPKTFDTKFNKMRDDHPGELMAKSIPPDLKKALGDMATSPREYGVAIDFEALDNMPERIVVNRGDDRSIFYDADFELNAHTHPPSGFQHSQSKGPNGINNDVKALKNRLVELEKRERNTPSHVYEDAIKDTKELLNSALARQKNGYGWQAYPSGNDVALTTFTRPNIMVYIDESGKRCYCLLRSLHEKIPDGKKFDEQARSIDAIAKRLHKEIGEFTTREKRNEFIKRFREELNKQGYDFKNITLDNPIPVRFDDVDERAITFQRYNKDMRQIWRDFRDRFQDPDLRINGIDIKDARVHGYFTQDGKEFILNYPKDLPKATRDVIGDEVDRFEKRWNLTSHLETMDYGYYWHFTRPQGAVFKKIQAGPRVSMFPPRERNTIE